MSDVTSPDVYAESYRKASKEHRCCECYQTIKKGDAYQHVKGLWDGYWEQFKTCSKCAEQRNSYRVEVGESPPFEGLREWCSNSDIKFWADEPEE